MVCNPISRQCLEGLNPFAKTQGQISNLEVHHAYHVDKCPLGSSDHLRLNTFYDIQGPYRQSFYHSRKCDVDSFFGKSCLVRQELAVLPHMGSL